MNKSKFDLGKTERLRDIADPESQINETDAYGRLHLLTAELSINMEAATQQMEY